MPQESKNKKSWNHREVVVDLGFHAFADTFIDLKKPDPLEVVLPLQVAFNSQTWLFETVVTTDPKLRYGGVPYSYTSSNSRIAREHWMSFASFLSKNFIGQETSILELGSNDGFLLSLLQHSAAYVLGVDASPAMVAQANLRGISSIEGIFGFDKSTIDNIKQVNKSWDLIIGTNVLNHSNSPLDFLSQVAEVLSDSGVFVIEVPYWMNVVRDLRFDQIYHEHTFYFTVKGLEMLASAAGLEVSSVEMIDYHGGSIRACLKKRNRAERVDRTFLGNLVDLEERAGLYEIETYIEFKNQIIDVKRRILKKLLAEREKSDFLFGVGAAAKGNTFLTFCGIDKTILDCVTESSPFKIGKVTPLTRIPIESDEVLAYYDQPKGILLAWNLREDLETKLRKINPNVRLIA